MEDVTAAQWQFESLSVEQCGEGKDEISSNMEGDRGLIKNLVTTNDLQMVLLVYTGITLLKTLSVGGNSCTFQRS